MSDIRNRLEKINATNASAATYKVNCKDCGARLPWNEAAAKKWKYDPKGPSFNAFYCFSCQGKL